MWWVLTDIAQHPGFTSLRVHSRTNAADYLFMAWSTTRPARTPIWRTVRGRLRFCGYNYVWDTPNINAQTQVGDTLRHSFYISGLPVGATVWYYLFASYGPYMREIQGPLMMANLRKPAAWSTRAYFATRTKGIFKTTDFSGPGGPQPTWIPDNAGLPFLDIRQACPDPWDPYHRRFIVCHGDVWRIDNAFIDDPAAATRILAQWEAVYLTGGYPGNILWVTTNRNFEGHLYVLFNSDFTTNGTWSLKTIDYGQSWTAHQITPAIYNYEAGNIQAGDFHRLSPYLPGTVLYAALCLNIGGQVIIFRSLDEGESWAPCPTRPPSFSIWEPRLYVDPYDQAIVYVGTHDPDPDLYRTLNHGATWTDCDAGNPLGLAVSPDSIYATMGTRPSNNQALRILTHLHIWKSSDFGEIWRDQGEVQYHTPHLHFRDDSPDYLYLARITNAPEPGGLYARHVLFVSDDEGSNMFGKAGAHAHLDDGGGDSIPWNSGGAAHQGILTLPWP